MDSSRCIFCKKGVENQVSFKCVRCAQFCHKKCLKKFIGFTKSPIEYICSECQKLMLKDEDIDIDESDVSDCTENINCDDGAVGTEDDTESDDNGLTDLSTDIRALESSIAEFVVMDADNNQWISSKKRPGRQSKVKTDRQVAFAEKPDYANDATTTSQTGLQLPGYFPSEAERDEMVVVTDEVVVTSTEHEDDEEPQYIYETFDALVPDHLVTKYPQCRPIDAFQQFFDDHLVEQLMRSTNAHNEQSASARGQIWELISKEEMLAVLGILVCMACYNCSNLPISKLWSHEHGIHLVKSTMTRDRFLTIIRLMRMEHHPHTDVPDKHSKIVPIRSFWQHFLANCRSSLIPGQLITVDEMFRKSRSSMRMFVDDDDKTAKSGFKIIIAADALSNYVHNAAVLVPSAVNEDAHNVDGFISGGAGTAGSPNIELVQRMVELYHGSGRNITMSKQFTDVSLAEYLLSKQLTVVGEISMHRKEVPKVLGHKERTVGSTISLFRNEVQLLSYCPRRNKVVRLLSTLHRERAENTGHTPEIVQFYNNTRDGVAVLDQIVSCGSTRRGSRRWTTAFFYTALDIALLNAHTFHSKILSDAGLSRPEFLFELAGQLCRANRLARGVPLLLEPLRAGRQAKGQCYVCLLDRHKRRNLIGKIKQRCKKCGHFCCSGHITVTCALCLKAK